MNATHYRTYVNGKNEHVCSLSEIHFHHRNTPLKLVLPKLHIQLCGFKNLLYLLMNACYVWYKTELGENKILIDLVVSHCLTSIKGAQKANTPLSHVQCDFLSNAVLVGKQSVVPATSPDRLKNKCCIGYFT